MTENMKNYMLKSYFPKQLSSQKNSYQYSGKNSRVAQVAQLVTEMNIENTVLSL